MKRFLKATLIILKRYGLQLWMLFFIANVAVIVSVRINAQNQQCLTTAQVSSDSRCLYIYNGSIYEKGTKSNPHHDHACGMDVTNIIPGSHIGDTASYLVPSYVGSICSATPTPTATLAPTTPPTTPPTQAPTTPPTQAPTTPPTTPPTQPPGSTVKPTTTPKATQTPTVTPKPTIQSTPTPLPQTTTPTPSPSPSPGYIADIGKFGQPIVATGVTQAPKSTPTEKPVSQTRYKLIYWTTIFAYISIAALIGVAIYWLGTKVIMVLKYRNGGGSPEKEK